MGFTTPTLRLPDGVRLSEGVRALLAGTRLRRVLTGAVGVVALFLVAVALGLGLYGYTHVDRIYQGVSVSGVSVGGMTEAEARAAIQQEFDRYLAGPVTLTLGDQTFSVTPVSAGVTLDADATIAEAQAYGRSGSWWARTRSWTRALLRGSDLPATLAVDDRRLDQTLSAFSPRVARPPVDAHISLEGVSAPEIVPEVPGIAFDLGSTRVGLLTHLADRAGGTVPIVAPELPASVKKEDLRPRLAEVQQAVDASLVLAGLDKFWAVSQADLKRIVSVPSPGEPVRIDTSAVTELVRGIAAEIEHPAVDARLYVDSNGELSVRRSDQSVVVDVDGTVERIAGALTAGTHEVELSISREAPAISDQQAEAALQRAEALVNGGLTLTWDGGSAKLGRSDLIAALTVTHRPGKADPIVIGFSPEVLGTLLGPVADEIDIAPSNGRYRWVDGKVKLVEKGTNGRAVNLDRSVSDVIDAVMEGRDSAALTVDPLKPEFTVNSAKKIKLPDVLGTAATYYGNSSDARRKNVERAVELQSGWLVAPGDVFSYAQNIGRVDEKNGFVTGLGILSDGAGGITTAPVIGGGICQVSTTIFQASFWAGLEVVERTAHPYWLQNYGQPPSGMLGLDAMVNIDDDPGLTLDLKFRNNTGNWIALVMYADGENVTAQILGTNPGWDIEVEPSKVTNIIDPPTETLYQDSPELPAGEERQVESAQQGFDTAIHRVVTDKSGGVIDDYTLSSTYVPSVNRILRGTGGA